MRKPLRDLKPGDLLELRNGTPVTFVKMYSAHDGQAAIVTIDAPSERDHGKRLKLSGFDSSDLRDRPMTKAEFFSKLADLYRVMNTADSDAPAADWLHVDMASSSGCRMIDGMLRNMEVVGALSAEEKAAFYQEVANA